MRAWVISDIHSLPLDWYRSPVTAPDADICLCAGDLTENIYTSIDYLVSQIGPKMPVICTLGNHDYYGSSIDKALEVARRQLKGTNVHLLEDDSLIIEGIRFLGATLWTDFEIPHGGPDELGVEERRKLALHVCLREIADFERIYRSDERKPGETGFVTVEELISRHRRSRLFIEAELAESFDGKTVVLTHHAPSAGSFHPAYVGDPTNAAFASDLTSTISSGRP